MGRWIGPEGPKCGWVDGQTGPNGPNTMGKQKGQDGQDIWACETGLNEPNGWAGRHTGLDGADEWAGRRDLMDWMDGQASGT